MLSNTWRTIALVGNDALSPPIYRFGATLVPIFDKDVVVRSQMDLVQKLKPKAHGPIPLERLLIFGGISIGEVSDEHSVSTLSDHIPCTVLHFTNSDEAPSEDSRDSSKK